MIFGAIGWRLMAWIGRAYRRKKISDQSLALIEKFRREGVDVVADQYPYDRASTNLGIRELKVRSKTYLPSDPCALT